MLRIASVLALCAVGCAHETPETKGLTQSGFDHAYDKVASGSQARARGDGYLVERTNDQSVRVIKETPTGGLGGDVSDAWITTKVKGKLGLEEGLSSKSIHVATDAGMVTLTGSVSSRGAAAKAIRDTLSLDGVTAVNSQLEWPGQMRAKRSPETTRF
jgi:osmotically-inducible protein OsmY